MKNPVNVGRHQTSLQCDCECGSLQVEYFDDEEVILSYNIPAFYAYQKNSWDRFKRSFNIIWDIIRGKEYRLYEICLDTKSKVKNFKDFVAKIDENKTIYED